MAEQDVITNAIAGLGQSQADRRDPALDAHYADVDERTPADLLRYARKLSGLLNYFPAADKAADGQPATVKAVGTWSGFLPADDAALDALPAATRGDVPPHQALLVAFLELYKLPQAVLNEFTGQHLDFHFKRVLRLANRPAEPDRAHVVVGLKKDAPPIVLGPADVLSAGKGAGGIELLYAPVRETVVNRATVDSVRSVYVGPDGGGTVRYAPVAKSADGLGGAFKDGADPRWPPFGGPALRPAEVGFALAARVLRLAEGDRTITLRLSLAGYDPARLTADALAGVFDAFATGDKAWVPLAPGPVGLDAAGNLSMAFTLAAADPPVVDYDPAVHGYRFAASAPVVQLLLNQADGDAMRYDLFRGATVRTARVSVRAEKLRSLDLESDAGAIDARKAFLPFGPRPSVNSTFLVGCPEALAKRLSRVELAVRWKGAPPDLKLWYAGYDNAPADNNALTVAVSFTAAGGVTYNQTHPLFESPNASTDHVLTFVPGSPTGTWQATVADRVRALTQVGSAWGRMEGGKLVKWRPVLRPSVDTAPGARPGFITLSLNQDFLHAAYPKLYATQVLAHVKGGGSAADLPNEPYTPAIQSLTLTYEADSDTVVVASEGTVPQARAAEADEAAFANPDVLFFHTAYSGQAREHGYLRRQLPFVPQKSVPLLPAYENAGELLVGMADLSPGDGVTVLFQVAEGSGDPDLPPPDVRWAVLCDNHWRPLGAGEVTNDTTGNLRVSGTVTFGIPTEATTENTVLPADRVWLRAAIAGPVGAACDMVDVVPNAIEVRYAGDVSAAGAPDLSAALLAGQIAKMKVPRAQVRSVAQPYASFGGRPAEADADFHGRVAERLRHKDRCVTPWDYERVVLAAFPRVHRVQCVPHAKPGSWSAPGHVLLVVVPDLANRNAVDPLRPRVDAGTLDQIQRHVAARTAGQMAVHVANPTYQRVQVDFKVRMRPGYEFNYYAGQVNRRLVEFLSPWAVAATDGGARADPAFGGTVYKSVLLDFVEDLPAVDYVTDFKMYTYADPAAARADVDEARPTAPDVILVSESDHRIAPA